MSQGTRLGSTEPYIEYSIGLNGGTQESEQLQVEAIGDILSEGEKTCLPLRFFGHLSNTVILKKL
jgi:wobble nucleotide-excising tRNase